MNYLSSFTVFLIFLICFLNYGYTARILGIFPFPGKSHFIVFEKIMRALSEKGHQVDVYGHWPLENPIEGYNDYSLRGSVEIPTGNITMQQIFETTGLTYALKDITELFGTKQCEAVFKHKHIQNLKHSNEKYDLLITEIFGSDCMLGFAHHFGVPSIIVASAAYFPWGSDFMGLPDNPAYIPIFYGGLSAKMTFYERLQNTIRLIFCKLYLEMLNSHFSINHARPLPPNVIEIGGVHINQLQTLNKKFSDLVENLNQDEKGVIYFTLGSLVQSETLPYKMLNAMFRALEKLPYRVLWKAKKENFLKNITIPKNIHFESWMPQFDLLCHPNVKLYISHGGNGGVQESVYCGVPILGLPLFGDQFMNIAQLQLLGMAEKLDLANIEEKGFFNLINRMLTDSRYQISAKTVQKNFKDRPMSPADHATYWIEYVINHRGATELRSASTKLNWFQYHLLDVVFVLIATPVLTIVLIFTAVKKLRRQFCKSSRSCKQKKN